LHPAGLLLLLLLLIVLEVLRTPGWRQHTECVVAAGCSKRCCMQAAPAAAVAA
jgi:hypothetical protein